MTTYELSPLWSAAFSPVGDGRDPERQQLAEAYRAFRERVAKLLQLIAIELPALTVHDITHVDALWHVASEIAGPNFPLNPAEAFVLGGAFLLHDAAHCRAAFVGGLEEIKSLPEWGDAAAQRALDPAGLVAGTEEFQSVLFDVLRVLHPKRARGLPEASWQAPGDATALKLLPHDELRQAYGAVIGEIAESHWWPVHDLEPLARRSLPPPVGLRGTGWDVDILKIALLLRTADAAHIDAERAPRFLFALLKPVGISRDHWAFQSKLHPGRCDGRTNELRIAGGPFGIQEQDAWWLAYDACRMIDRELAAADELLRDANRQRFAARAVEGAHHPESFARNVAVAGWHPVDASIRITDISRVVEQFGGRKLYGDKPYLALRELLQNARDAVLACRALGALGEAEGRIDVEIESVDGEDWLHVTDTGIGMSRYVLTRVLLDFGRSLWRDQSVRNEWPGLAASKFEAVGQFGIGFFSVFMLGDKVRVISRRLERSHGDDQDQWVLEFHHGTAGRPVLRPPAEEERLSRHGTRVSVRLTAATDLLVKRTSYFDLFAGGTETKLTALSLHAVAGALAPALEVDLWAREGGAESSQVLRAGDWKTIDSQALLTRIAPECEPNQSGLFRGDFQGSIDRLERIEGGSGDCWGRCAVTSQTVRFFAVSVGVVTVGGLWGGEINGFHGLLVGRPQNRLDRDGAVPAVPLDFLAVWANRQAGLLLEGKKLTLGLSKTLIALGADPEDLLVVEHHGNALSTKSFRAALADTEEVWLLPENEMRHASDDEVLQADFERSFEPDQKVFVADMTETRNAFVTSVSWPERSDPPARRCPANVVERVVNEAWPDAVGEKDQDQTVGYVLGTPITRQLTVIRRSKPTE
ncbi:MAG: ATP-binding protein [Sulfuritalea sp.]|nr:ATP-binding protein [Sulfuritalea sp.]MDP1982198.1 ATP-binding protein [Sulfuritalea sp.]